MRKFNSNKFLLFLNLSLVVFVLTACFKNLTIENMVYYNDFETGQLQGIEVSRFYLSTDTAKIFNYNGSKVLGGFNNGRFTIFLNNLPEHNAISVEFDLYIHGPWQGDHLSSFNIPDLWSIKIDDRNILLTTFSNTNYPQAYPNYYLTGTEYPARGDSWVDKMPGVCSTANQPDATSWYKYITTVKHNQDSVTIICNDALQPYNTGCIKSWSVDNVKVTAIKY